MTAQEEVHNDPPETLIVFDCRGPGAKNRFQRERHAWGASATAEILEYGRVVLVVRPGCAGELAT